jgi:prepilin-type N-terminal cleavage/methylation domain-containing protein
VEARPVMQLRGPRRDESGFTLTELLITMTITALIGGVVAQTFLLTLKLGPETTARNKFATDTTFLTSALSDDVANATAQPTGVSVSASNCVLQTVELGVFPLPTGSSHWFAVISNPTGTPATVYSMQVFRQLNTDSTPTVMLNAYCARSPDPRYTGVIAITTVTDPGYALDLKLLPSSKEAERTISFRGDRRTLTPPT